MKIKKILNSFRNSLVLRCQHLLNKVGKVIIIIIMTKAEITLLLKMRKCHSHHIRAIKQLKRNRVIDILISKTESSLTHMCIQWFLLKVSISRTDLYLSMNLLDILLKEQAIKYLFKMTPLAMIWMSILTNPPKISRQYWAVVITWE